MKKILLGIAAVGVTLVGASMFAAFEAHVVNVTARIENALQVTTKAIEFGTVFPQEHLDQPLEVALSRSFLDEDRVDDVSYFIRQKPKCALTNEAGTEIIGPTATGHVNVNPDTGEVTIDCGDAPVDTDGEPLPGTWGVLPSLCEYISKEGEDQNDGTLPSFHQPWQVVRNDAGTPVDLTDDFYELDWNDTLGYMSQLAQDVVDNWNIDLAVPCFGGYCAQDWADFVHGINPIANPNDYTQSIDNEHKVFGCDLWVEVSDVSETPLNGETGPT